MTSGSTKAKKELLCVRRRGATAKGLNNHPSSHDTEKQTVQGAGRQVGFTGRRSDDTRDALPSLCLDAPANSPITQRLPGALPGRRWGDASKDHNSTSAHDIRWAPIRSDAARDVLPNIPEKTIFHLRNSCPASVTVMQVSATMH